MAEITKLIIESGDKEYSFTGGGGSLAPNSVGTEELKDGAVEMQDLHEDVKNAMTDHYDASRETLFINGARPKAVEMETAAEDGGDEI